MNNTKREYNSPGDKIKAIALALHVSWDKELTSYQVAKKVGLSPNTARKYLLAMLESDMVCVSWYTHRPNSVKAAFSINGDNVQVMQMIMRELGV